MSRTALDPRDPLGFDDLLSPEDLAVRDTVRAWCDDRVLPHIAEWYERGELPEVRELARELGSIGALGMHLEGYGCAGASAVQYGLACVELEAADSGLRSLVSVQGSLAMYAIHRWGSEEQRQQLAAGDGRGRDHRLLRPHRAGPRLRPGLDAHPRQARRQGTGC